MTPEERREKNRLSQQRRRANNPDRIRELDREARRRNPEAYAARQRKWRQSMGDDMRAKINATWRKGWRRRRDAEDATLPARPEACQVCSRPGVVCMDHSHTTKQFRGWLCHGCNLVLGHAKDNPYLLRELADYLERHVELCEG